MDSTSSDITPKKTRLNQILRDYWGALVIAFVYILTVNSFIGNTDNIISGDGQGYYDYLPSLFIHDDFIRKNTTIESQPELYQRIDHIGAYVEYGDQVVNKYTCGTALLELPLFLVEYAISERTGQVNDGYQNGFHRAVFHTAIAFLIFGLVYFRKLLKAYHLDEKMIFLSQVLILFATGLTNYANYDASYSHVYSFFAITAFLYYCHKYFHTRSYQSLIVAALLLGLIFILRQINILVVLALPFVAGSWENFKNGIKDASSQPKWLLRLILLLVIFPLIQSLTWYLQTGDFILYSYQEEGFNWLEPEIWNILFSYTHGLFVFAPILFLCVGSLVQFIIKKQYYLVISWVLFLFILSYVFSSWWTWEYGCSYGSRPFVEFFAIFFIPLALVLQKSKPLVKSILIVVCGILCIINVVQTFQYKSYILKWEDFSAEEYWEVFLETDEKYRGLYWKRTFDIDEYDVLDEINLGDQIILRDSTKIVPFSIRNDSASYHHMNVIQVFFESDFDKTNDAKIGVRIEHLDSILYYHKVPLIQFKEDRFGIKHTGVFNFELPDIDSSSNLNAACWLIGKENNLKIDNLKVQLLKWK